MFTLLRTGQGRTAGRIAPANILLSPLSFSLSQTSIEEFAIYLFSENFLSHFCRFVSLSVERVVKNLGESDDLSRGETRIIFVAGFYKQFQNLNTGQRRTIELKTGNYRGIT